MALIGKELGKEVGEWFGPSTAAGALKTLVNSFPLCGLGVVNAVDGTIYRSDVYSASNISSDAWVEDDDAPRRSRPSSVHRTGWGGKPVLILIGLRLGVDGVNPIYYDSIKTLFTFPHSVGIAGGRPSSSYYFVASQGNSLFYLDPHFTRPAVPLRVPPPKAARPPGRRAASVFASERDSVHFEDDDDDSVSLAPAISRTSESSPLPIVDVVNLDNDVPEPVSELQSPSKPRRRLTLTQTLRIKPGSPSRKSSAPASPTTPTIKGLGRRTSQPSPSPSRPAPTRHSTASSSSSLRSRALPVDPQTAWYASAYSEANLKTFHCDKVKKLPLSGLDPSMLIGFLCQTEAEFDDFCERVAKVS
jgi:cysteine protease ATG4